LKKILLLSILLGLSSGLFAKGGSTTVGALGLNYSFFSTYTGGLGLTGIIGHQNRPFQISLHWDFAGAYFGATVDWLFLRNPIPGTPLWYYVGVGLGIGLGGGFNFGARVPLAIQWFPVPPLEFYLEYAPGARILLTLAFDHSLTLGARFHFGK
jgi:hypothetical protein